MTERLYYRDPYLARFEANVIEAVEGGRRVYLDRTAFYPTSGGQPFDIGTLGGVLLLGLVSNSMNLLGVGAIYQNAVLGLIITASVLAQKKPQ